MLSSTQARSAPCRPHHGRCRFAATVMMLAALTSACRVEIDQEELREARFATARELCIAARPSGLDQGGGFSLAFAEGAYWIFSDTWVGDRVVSSSGATTPRDRPPCGAGDFEYVRDASDQLAQIIPLTADELAEETRIAIWPYAGFVHEGRGIVYFQKVRMRDYFDLDLIGTGAARVEFGGIGERLVPGHYSHEPTLLWLDPQSGWGANGALLSPDGFAYVYGCYQASVWDRFCRVGRVEPARAGERAAYEYWNGDGWSPEPERAAVVLEGATRLSVSYNAHLGKYIALYNGLFENRVLARTAKAPWGPFSEPIELYTGTAPSDFWIRDLEQHVAYERDGSQKLLTSYFSSPSEGPAGTRLVEITLR
jgi:hypothetical protein